MPGSIRDVEEFLFQQADAAASRGEIESSNAMLRAVVLLHGVTNLPEARAALKELESSANLQSVTGAQLERRGKAIAKAKASKSDDRLWKAIVQSRWGSQERYAKERLKVSPGSLSAYRSGNTPVPRAVVRQVEKDFDIGADYWPGSIVD